MRSSVARSGHHAELCVCPYFQGVVIGPGAHIIRAIRTAPSGAIEIPTLDLGSLSITSQAIARSAHVSSVACRSQRIHLKTTWAAALGRGAGSRNILLDRHRAKRSFLLTTRGYAQIPTSARRPMTSSSVPSLPLQGATWSCLPDCHCKGFRAFHGPPTHIHAVQGMGNKKIATTLGLRQSTTERWLQRRRSEDEIVPHNVRRPRGEEAARINSAKHVINTHLTLQGMSPQAKGLPCHRRRVFSRSTEMADHIVTAQRNSEKHGVNRQLRLHGILHRHRQHTFLPK